MTTVNGTMQSLCSEHEIDYVDHCLEHDVPIEVTADRLAVVQEHKSDGTIPREGCFVINGTFLVIYQEYSSGKRVLTVRYTPDAEEQEVLKAVQEMLPTDVHALTM